MKELLLFSPEKTRGRILKACFALIFCASAFGLFLLASERFDFFKGATRAEKAAWQRTLIMGNGADPASLDPNLATGLGDAKILNAIFEGLVSADEESLKTIPAAARKWTVSEDGKTYTFYIDPNARWSNGDKLSAKDFEFAWRRILNPKLGAEYASMLFPIKNARDVSRGLLPPEELGARALGDDIFEVRLERPTPYFLDMLYHCAFFPLHEATLKKFNAQSSRDAIWTRPQNIVSNGPFILKEWRINEKVEVVKNPFYRESESIFLQKIIFLPISNVNTEDRAFRAGQLHLTESVAPSRLGEISASAPETLRNAPWLGVYYYAINNSRPPLDNPRVRKALSMAIDRRLIISNFLKGGQNPAFSFVPFGMADFDETFDEEKFISENAEEAKKLLSEAGFPDGKNFPKIRISYNTSEQHKPIAEAIQRMWKKHLNIDAELYNLSWPAYLSARSEGDFEISRASWVADFAAPESFLHIFRSESGLNHGKYSNKKFDELLDSAEKAKTSEDRFSKLREAESILVKEDAAIIPIYFYKKVHLVSPILQNWKENALDYHNYKKARLQVDRESEKN